MAAMVRRLVILGMTCVMVLLPAAACVRAKPLRELPAVGQVFGEPQGAAQAEVNEPAAVATPAQPTPTTADALLIAPTSTPAAALIIVAATATAMAASVSATVTPEPTSTPILVPTQTPVPLDASLDTYVVAEGDTLYSIAKEHGTTVAALQAVNGLGASDHIEFGQTLYLPADAQPSSGVKVKTTGYWVARGENLSMIAQRYKTTVEEILAANPGLEDEDEIYVGMHIIVPVNTVPQRTHRVQYGESLSGIAARYGVSVRSIVQANGLRSANQIYAGQVLVIPD